MLFVSENLAVNGNVQKRGHPAAGGLFASKNIQARHEGVTADLNS
jgi:hypothetical protein